MNNNIEKSKDLFPFRIVSETPTGDGYVDCDCVWFDDLDEGLELSGFFSPKTR